MTTSQIQSFSSQKLSLIHLVKLIIQLAKESSNKLIYFYFK